MFSFSVISLHFFFIVKWNIKGRTIYSYNFLLTSFWCTDVIFCFIYSCVTFSVLFTIAFFCFSSLSLLSTDKDFFCCCWQIPCRPFIKLSVCFHTFTLKPVLLVVVRALTLTRTPWWVWRTWCELVEECGWRSQKASHFDSSTPKHWSTCRRSTSQHALHIWVQASLGHTAEYIVK